MRRNVELVAAFACIVLITGIYMAASSSDPLSASTILGHWIGIVGFVFMLMTETLYSLRKQSRHIRWGPMETWFSAHIFTGIVGPYMVFLHTGFQFGGLAGVAMWLTVTVVASGFIGRYVYTTLPRTSAGAEMGAPQLESALRRAQTRLDAWLRAHSPHWQVLASEMGDLPVVSRTGLGSVLRQPGIDRQYRRQWRRAVRELDMAHRAQAVDLGRLLYKRRTLQRQIEMLVTQRRIMAVWHTMHVPLGLVLFTVAFLHLVAALFYSQGVIG
jgi:hypothetical protein